MPHRGSERMALRLNAAAFPAGLLPVGLAVVLAAGCAARTGAPVVERAPPAKPAPAQPAAAKPAVVAKPAVRPPEARPSFHTVRKGETLFSIALDYGLDYRDLAQWNGIADPGLIQIGQRLQLHPPQQAVTVAPLKPAPGVQAKPLGDGAVAGGNVLTEPRAVRAPYSDKTYAQLAGIRPEPVPRAEPRAPARGEGEDAVEWSWPASGKVVSQFNDGAKLKGISIAGKLGQPVLASAPGRVIFSGTGIRGFGKLIVIKHNDTFLSVYAHNSELLVKEGQNVTRGQKIAEMGSTDTDQVKLHFEIRRFGKPVDPVKFLPPT
jgi:lipoprotein NlpD